jgi:DIM1 family U5 snRNP protein
LRLFITTHHHNIYITTSSRTATASANFQTTPATKTSPQLLALTPALPSHNNFHNNNHGLRRNPPPRHRLARRPSLVVIRFGRDWDPDCMRQDEVLYKIADRVKNFAVIYVCDLDQVPDFKQMYELYDTVTMMFFFRNKHMMCDFGTGNNNKLNWVLEDKQELIDIIETIYKGAKKGRGLVVSPKDYSTRYRY